jgi:sulfopyruvate decarboxylase TPP-binding subunit
MDEVGLAGGEIIAALKRARIEYVVALPDITTSAGVLWPISRDPHFKLVRLCKEDEGVAICAGLAITQHRAALLIQYTGFLDSLNAVRAIACDYALPICMVVGLLEKEPNVKPRESKRFGVRIMEPILETMGIDHFCMEASQDIALLPPAIDRAFEMSRPVVALVGQRVRP